MHTTSSSSSSGLSRLIRIGHQPWTRTLRALLALVLAAALAASACDLVGDEDDQQQQQSQQQSQQQDEEQAEAEPAPAPTPAARAAAQPQQDDEPAPAAAPPARVGDDAGARAYQIVFPSLALVMTGNGAATGLVLADGHILVDGSALRADDIVAADVILSSGELIEQVPLSGAHLLSDIAILGPIDRGTVAFLPGATLADGEQLPFGTGVYSVGFSAADRAGAQPAVSLGVLGSRLEWEAGGITLLLTDAEAAYDRSGAVLVTEAGQVVGIATAATALLGHYVSAADLALSLPPQGLAPAFGPDPASASTEHSFDLPATDSAASLFTAADSNADAIALSVESEADATLLIADTDGNILQEIPLTPGATIVNAPLPAGGPFSVSILTPPGFDGEEANDGEEAMASDDTLSFRVSSDLPLLRLSEHDEQQQPVIDGAIVGSIDFAGDSDTYMLPLRTGDVYEVRVESLTIDVTLMVMGGGVDGVDDDSAGGLRNTDAVLELAPQQDGLALLTVREYGDHAVGSYVLSVTRTQTAPEAVVAESDGGPQLPAPPNPPALSMRGVQGDDGLQPQLLGLASEASGDALVVADNDGHFEIVASLIGTQGASARVVVINSAGGETVLEGRVVAACPDVQPCLAMAIFIANEGEPGIWLVRMEHAAGSIDEWQVAVHPRD